MKTAKIIGHIFNFILGFFLMLLLVFILRKTSQWFEIPFLMNQSRSFFIGFTCVAHVLFIATYGQYAISKAVKELIDTDYSDDKDSFEAGWLFLKPFVFALLYMLAFGSVYLYYIILT